MLKTKKAIYKCLNCRHKWSDWPGPGSTFWQMQAVSGIISEEEASRHFCPACGTLYAKWLNYKEFVSYDNL